MKISHESPLALLKISRAYNDYDYALVHLFEKVHKLIIFLPDLQMPNFLPLKQILIH